MVLNTVGFFNTHTCISTAYASQKCWHVSYWNACWEPP